MPKKSRGENHETILHATQKLRPVKRKEKFEASYLLSISVGLECDVPVVVVCKLDTYHLWTVVIFEQCLYFL